MIEYALPPFQITPTPLPVGQGNGFSVPEWFQLAVTLFSGGVGAYLVRQFVERIKLKKAIQAEVGGMDGLISCKRALRNREAKPSERAITPKEVPSPGTIPTQVYEANIDRIGLLKSEDLGKVVRFYTDVLYYKTIIGDIREGNEVPEPDQNDLYDSIAVLEERRQSLFGDGWLEDDSRESDSRD